MKRLRFRDNFEAVSKKRFLKKARKNFCSLGAWGPGLPLIATFGGD
jgi:hypothetical protein